MTSRVLSKAEQVLHDCPMNDYYDDAVDLINAGLDADVVKHFYSGIEIDASSTDTKWGEEAFKRLMKDNQTILKKYKERLEMEEEKKNAWSNSVGHLTAKYSEDKRINKDLMKLLGELNGDTEIDENVSGNGDLTMKTIKLPLHTLKYLHRLVMADKAKAEETYSKVRKPKFNTTKGRRAIHTSVPRNLKNADSPQGSDNPYYFKGDEEAYYDKSSGKRNKDGQINVIRKACKSTRYMGGAESREDDEYCNGAITWDRSMGSKALECLPCGKSAFRIRCGNLKNENGYCADCSAKFRKGKGKNFFKNGWSKKAGDYSYQQLIMEFLDYA